MSFAAKVDFAGLARTGLALRSNGQNATNTVLEIPGSDGSILGDIITGHIKNPTCGYAINGTAQLSGLQLGKVHNTELSAPYALTRVRISTGAGQEPTVEADCVQIESGATRSICVYDVPAQTVTPARHALTFGAFTYTESTDLVLENSQFEATANLAPTTVNNEPVASDSTGGVATVQATFWASSETEPPAVTPTSAWHVTQDWSCTGADASLYSWTATFTNYLSAQMAI